MKVSDFFSALGDSGKSLVKIILQSRPTGLKNLHPQGPLIIMANGPSLNETISENKETLCKTATMSVNFAPLSPVFFEIRPKYHILADPLFFAGDKAPENVGVLYAKLAEVEWPLTLLVPVRFAKKLPSEIRNNQNITVSKFNFVGAEGFKWLERLLFGHKLAMPRPRNVLIPALMCGIWLGYDEIFITGADHSWMQTISVDDNNNVISVQPHFYKEDKREQQRVDSTYRNYRLHDIVRSFYVAFRSYHLLQRFAVKSNVKIFNSTPGSFIDSFPRKPLPKG